MTETTTVSEIIDAALHEHDRGWHDYAAGHTAAEETSALLKGYTRGWVPSDDEAVAVYDAIFDGIQAAIDEGIADSDSDGGLMQYGIGAALDLIPSEYVTV